MSSRQLRVALLVMALLRVTNPLWLVPHEGETRYTYERSRIAVEDGTLVYQRSDLSDFDAERRNSLNPVGCQHDDEEGTRACAFDQHLVDHAPVTVPQPPELRANPARPEFVRINDAYYRRIHDTRSDGSLNVTYDVERVTPQTVLAESAVNLSGVSSPSDGLLRRRVAITGNTETSYERLDDDELGNVYRLNGTYYTVVVTDVEHIFHDGFELLRYDLFRAMLAVPGVFILILFAWSLHSKAYERRERP